MYAGLSLEKYNYLVSEGDGYVEACGNLYGRQGLSVDVRFSTSSSSAQAGRDFIHVREVLQMTSGERRCWNITILEDSISEGQQTYFVGVEQFYISLRPLRASVGSTSARVYIRDNDRDTLYLQLQDNRDSPFSCDGSLNHYAAEGDDPLEICVRSSGSEGDMIEANVIMVDETATGTYVLTVCVHVRLWVPFSFNHFPFFIGKETQGT